MCRSLDRHSRPHRGALRTPLVLALTFSVVGGCSRSCDEAATMDREGEAVELRAAEAPPTSPEGPPAPSEEPPLFSASRSMMGTVFLIKVEAPSEVAEPAVEEAFAEIARLERLLSEWDPESTISLINAAAGEQPVRVDDDTWRVVEAGLEVSRWSRGAFDLSWAALRGLYDFRPGRGRAPAPGALEAALAKVDYRRIELDEEAQTVFLTEDGMAIGTGGIAKGYALDRAGDVLESHGIESYMLFGGGQVQVHGLRGDRPWRIGIQHPRNPRSYFAFLESTGGSVSTSGDYERFFIDAESRRWHHILDLDTGKPSRESVSVTLLAPSGLYADALSTAAFVLGPEGARAMLDRIPLEVELVQLGSECDLHTTPGTREKLVFRAEIVEGRLPACGSEAP